MPVDMEILSRLIVGAVQIGMRYRGVSYTRLTPKLLGAECSANMADGRKRRCNTGLGHMPTKRPSR